MRTKNLLLSAAAIVAGALSAQAQQNVYSVNVVGYVNKTLLGSGKYTLIANPLNSPTNTLDALIKPVLPVNGKVLKWNGTSFSIYTRVAFGTGWNPSTAGSVTLNPGEGAFIQTPASSTDLTNTFVGEVLQGNLTNTYPVGYTLSGNLVADAGVISSLQLTNVPTNTKFNLWNPTTQAYSIYTKVAFGTGWNPSVPTLNVADGFFVNPPSSFNWVRNFTVQ